MAAGAIICFYSLEGRQTLRLFLPSNSPPFAGVFPVTKRYSGRDFPTEVTPSTSWGGRQTGFAGRQTASPYGSPGRPFHCACRLMLDRLLILATIVASAFALNVQKYIRLRSARFPVRNTTICGWQIQINRGMGCNPIKTVRPPARRVARCLAAPMSRLNQKVCQSPPGVRGRSPCKGRQAVRSSPG